jgi:RimJ/RimL family protein N-acetyltransferase
MFERKRVDFMSIAQLCQQTHFGVLTAGTVEGLHPGRVFVDDAVHPQVGLVCTTAGYYFLIGNPACEHVISEIDQLFRSELAPSQQKRLSDPQVLLFYEPSSWKDPLQQIFADLHPLVIRKKRMILDCTRDCVGESWHTQIPDGMHMVRMSPELLEQHPPEAETARLFWGSLESFAMNSLGVCLLDGDTLVSTCEAVFIGAGEAEISVATSLEYRRRGLARLVAGAFIEACLERELQPIWGCWPENLPSISLAHSLGFIEDRDQETLLIEFPPVDNHG